MLSFKKTFKSVDRMFLASGIPPCSSFYPENFLQALRMNVCFIIVFILLLYTEIGEIVYLARMLQGDFSFLEITFQAPCIGYCSIGLMKMFVLAANRNTIAKLVCSLRESWDNSIRSAEQEKICGEVLNPAIYYTTLTAVVNVVMGIAFTILPVLEMVYHYWITGQWVHQLPFLIWWPFDAYSGITYFFIYPLYIVIGFSGIIIHMAFDCLFCMLCAHLCMHFKILQHDLARIIPDKDARGLNVPSLPPFENCFQLIQKHQYLNECKNTMDRIFSLALCYNFFISSIIICIQGFMVTAANGYTLVKFALFLASFLVELFLLCFYGHDIYESSSDIANAAYSCLWYQQNVQFCKLIQQIIVRTQRPLVLRAWKFWPVNVETFSRILSASWSYFTLLRTVYAK